MTGPKVKVAAAKPAARKTKARDAQFEARRLEVLRGVALAFAEDGYHQTTVNSLAERLGVSKPVLYYYAKNKDDLLYQCGDVARVELRAAITSARHVGMSGMGTVRRFFSTYAEIMCGDFGRCLVLIDPKALSPKARENDTILRRDTEQAIIDMIIEGQADGSIGKFNPVLASRALFGAFNGIPRWFSPDGDLTARDVAESFIDLFVSGMGRG